MRFRNLGIVVLGIVILTQPAFAGRLFVRKPSPNPTTPKPQPLGHPNVQTGTVSGSGTLTIATASATPSDYWQGTTTTVEAGTFEVLNDNTLDQGELLSSQITINPGATFDVDDYSRYFIQPNQNLNGSGTVVANNLKVLEGSSVMPGDSVGTLNVNGLLFAGTTANDGSVVGGTENDLINVTGGLDISINGNNAEQFTVNIHPVTGSLGNLTWSGGSTGVWDIKSGIDHNGGTDEVFFDLDHVIFVGGSTTIPPGTTNDSGIYLYEQINPGSVAFNTTVIVLGTLTPPVGFDIGMSSATTMHIELARLDNGPALNTTGNITLAGGLSIIQPTEVSLGDEYILASAQGSQGITNRFDQIRISGTGFNDAINAFAVLYEDTDADALTDRVRLLATLKGDANGDGVVSLADLDALGKHFGQAGAWQDGDFDYDGQVDLADLDALATQFVKPATTMTAPGSGFKFTSGVDLNALGLGFGQTSGLAQGDFKYDGNVSFVDLDFLGVNFDNTIVAPAAIPEPASVALLALGGLALVRRRARG